MGLFPPSCQHAPLRDEEREGRLKNGPPLLLLLAFLWISFPRSKRGESPKPPLYRSLLTLALLTLARVCSKGRLFRAIREGRMKVLTLSSFFYFFIFCLAGDGGRGRSSLDTLPPPRLSFPPPPLDCNLVWYIFKKRTFSLF